MPPGARNLLPSALAFCSALVFCLLSLSGLALAQSKVRTVILGDQLDPVSTSNTFDTDQPVDFEFRTDSLPVNATVSGAALQLVASDPLDGSDVRIDVSAGSVIFGSRGFGKNSPEIGERVVWKATDDAVTKIREGGSQTVLTLRLKANRTGIKTRQWYSPAADTEFRPRLILDYTQPGWTQPWDAVGLVGVEGTRAFVPIVGDQQTKLSKDVSVLPFPVPKMRTNTPAFGHGLVYVVTGDSQSTSVEARLPLSGELVWSEAAQGAGKHIVLAPSNRLYVVGSEQIFTYVIDPLNPRARPKPRVASNGPLPFLKSVPGLDPLVPPEVGPDGSLYLVSSGRIVALNPDLVEVWSKQVKGKVGPITVDPSGRFVYLTSAEDGQLWAFDAQTGRLYTVDLINQATLNSFNDPALHAPVVVRMEDGTTNIFVGTATGTDGSLTLVKNGMLRDVAPSTTLERHDPALMGLWSQLIPQPHGTAARGQSPGVLGISRAKGAIPGISDVVLVRGGSIDQRRSVTAPDSIFNTVGRPVVDARGAVHIWNGGQAYPIRNLLTGASVDFQFPVGQAPRARLIFGGDGTLYVHNPDDLSLQVVLPQVVLGGQDNAGVDAPMNVAVGGRGGSGTTIKAHGAVVFLPDTTLSVGTRVLTGQP